MGKKHPFDAQDVRKYQNHLTEPFNRQSLTNLETSQQAEIKRAGNRHILGQHTCMNWSVYKKKSPRAREPDGHWRQAPSGHSTPTATPRTVEEVEACSMPQSSRWCSQWGTRVRIQFWSIFPHISRQFLRLCPLQLFTITMKTFFVNFIFFNIFLFISERKREKHWCSAASCKTPLPQLGIKPATWASNCDLVYGLTLNHWATLAGLINPSWSVCRWGCWGPRRVSCFPKVIQLGPEPRCPCLLAHSFHCFAGLHCALKSHHQFWGMRKEDKRVAKQLLNNKDFV